jgi:peptidoglycan/LPS O-acetylase OafA/YrhL
MRVPYAPLQLPYRPEIDGLRAIAIVAVVLYHAGLPWVPGGFTGVDVFFVLSGFLIGGLLWTELCRSGHIALGAFWMRRLRRLAPAYLVMAVTVIVAGYLILLPADLRELGKETIAATLWFSNVLFWRGAGYFDGAASEKPMLHTWSLSVEEQFYVALPLLLLTLFRLRTRPRAVVGILATTWAASLGAMLLLTPSRPDAAFYLFPFRAWELLTGVLLAILKPVLSERVRTPLGWAGLALILVSILRIRAEGFPGAQAMLPVAGTALALLAIGGDAPAGPGRLLALPGPVFIGRISYGLYLWHWPILVLATYWRGEMDGAERGAWLALSGLLATLSWRYVEAPVRRPASAGGVASTAVIAGLGSGAVLVLATGTVFYRTDGLPARFPNELRAYIDASGDFLQDWSRCEVPDEGPLAGIESCAIGPQAPPRVLIWGDSHLRALMDGLADAARAAETPGLIVWRAGCPPLLGLAKRESAATPAQDAACPLATAQVLEAIRKSETLETVILVGRWTYYAEGAGIGRDAHNTISISALPGSSLSGGTQAGLYAEAVEMTVETLRGFGLNVAVFRQVPEIPNYDSRGIARALAHGRLTAETVEPLLVAQPEALAARVRSAEAPLWQLEADGAIEFVDPWPFLCRDLCRVTEGERVLYFDNNHLTNAGARYLAPLFASLFEEEAL